MLSNIKLYKVERNKIHEENLLKEYNQLKVDYDLKYNAFYQQVF